jgi:hypothetical protein
MPSDFDFLVQFGVQSKNEINTFDNIVIKDLIAEGTALTETSFTEEEMKKIYQKMREINIMESKELVPEKTNCMQTPYGEDKWKIKLNGERKHFTGLVNIAKQQMTHNIYRAKKLHTRYSKK